MSWNSSDNTKEARRLKAAGRRSVWITENGPCTKCNSSDQLEVDHRDASKKRFSVSSLWLLSPFNPMVIAELAKCQVLCHTCHVEKALLLHEHSHGESHYQTTLTDADVSEMRRIYALGGSTYAGIGRSYGIPDRSVARKMIIGKTWTHIPV